MKSTGEEKFQDDNTMRFAESVFAARGHSEKGPDYVCYNVQIHDSIMRVGKDWGMVPGYNPCACGRMKKGDID